MNIISTSTGVKVGSKGKVANTPEKVSELLGSVDKGTARKIRRSLRSAGHNNLAGVKRAA